MSVQNGSKVNLASLSIGEEITGEGDLTVTGTGSSVIVRNDLYIGNQGKASTQRREYTELLLVLAWRLW